MSESKTVTLMAQDGPTFTAKKEVVELLQTVKAALEGWLKVGFFDHTTQFPDLLSVYLLPRTLRHQG
jgi:hypothetical protein